ncbi:MAG: hypothetical protein DMF58_06480 [Acidobacteria bacterium]|nr:MAG: hypothetical protein DMF58_06480 [Acidobacteriota bacterium]
MDAGLDIARSRQLADLELRELPSIGDSFQLFPAHARLAAHDPFVVLAKLAIVPTSKAVAHHAAFRSVPADRGIAVETIQQFAAQDVDRLRSVDELRFCAGHVNKIASTAARFTTPRGGATHADG